MADASPFSLLPLSIGQERIYHLVGLHPDVPLYNMAAAYRLRGPLDVTSLRRAVGQIECDQSVLRTSIPPLNGNGVLSLCTVEGRPGTFTCTEIGPVPPASLPHLVNAEAGNSFDLEVGPLWRVTLFRIDAGEHLLLLTMHHIITDGWSYALFTRELGRFYSALVEGEAVVPGPPPMDYAAFGQRQREFLASEACDRQRDYWRRRFAEPPPALALPGHVTGDIFDDRAAASVPIALPPALSEALATFSQATQTTLFMTLLAGFAGLLSTISGQRDILLCAPVSGRHRAGARDLIGYFNNILLLRLDLSGDPGFSALTARCREIALEAYKHQDVPFQWIANLPPLRNVPLSRLLFSFDQPWPPKLELAGIVTETYPVETGAADFDLAVSVWQRDGGIFGSLRYKKNQFAEGAVLTLAQAYSELLAAAIADPERPLSELARSVVANHAFAAEPSVPEERGMPFAPPRSSVEMQLTNLWQEVLAQRPIGIKDTLRSLGASSLAVVELGERVRALFGINLSIDAIFRAATIEEIARLLHANPGSRSESPLAPIQPKGSRRPLFLCEGVGIYYPLSNRLGDEQPIYGLITDVIDEYPSVESLATRYIDAMREVQPKGPYHLGGISFGGLVAYEMAQQLRALGEEVGLVALFDTPGPGAFRRGALLTRLIGHTRNLLHFGRPYLEQRMQSLLKRIHRLDGRVPSPLNDTGDIRNSFRRSAQNYRIKPYDGRLTLFMLAHRDAMTDSLFDPMLGQVDPYLGWGHVARGGVDRHMLEGEHTTILQELFVEPIARVLAELTSLDVDFAPASSGIAGGRSLR